MPQVQLIYGRNRRSMAQALAKAVASLRDERKTSEGSRVERVAVVVWEFTAVVTLCYALFLIARLAMVFWS